MSCGMFCIMHYYKPIISKLTVHTHKDTCSSLSMSPGQSLKEMEHNFYNFSFSTLITRQQDIQTLLFLSFIFVCCSLITIIITPISLLQWLLTSTIAHMPFSWACYPYRVLLGTQLWSHLQPRLPLNSRVKVCRQYACKMYIHVNYTNTRIILNILNYIIWITLYELYCMNYIEHEISFEAWEFWSPDSCLTCTIYYMLTIQLYVLHIPGVNFWQVLYKISDCTPSISLTLLSCGWVPLFPVQFI